MADAIRSAAAELVTIVLNQCGGYLSGPGFEAAQAARKLREALVEQPAKGEAVGRQYYFRVSDCPAKEATDPDCICWHDSGTGPCKTAREADRDSFSVCLEWRDKPAPPAPAVPDDVAKDAARYRWLRDESRPIDELFMATRADRAGTYRVSNEMDDIIDAAMLAAAPEQPR